MDVQRPQYWRPDRTVDGSGGRAPVLGALAAVLVLLGVVMVLSAASVQDLRDHGDAWYHVRRQVVWIALGTVGLVTMLRIDYRRLRGVAPTMLVATIVLLALVFDPSPELSVGWCREGAFSLAVRQELREAIEPVLGELYRVRRVESLRGPGPGARVGLGLALQGLHGCYWWGIGLPRLAGSLQRYSGSRMPAAVAFSAALLREAKGDGAAAALRRWNASVVVSVVLQQSLEGWMEAFGRAAKPGS